ncbi:MAG: ribonuclease T2 [Pseudoruegeria sp.]
MRLGILAVLAVCFGGVLHADEEKAGTFDYYVLALSWSPNWCKLEGEDRNSEQCDDGRALGWVLHGLWPQYERGWPTYCSTPHREASRSETNAMADIMGTSGSAWHQWKKHGRCSGLSAALYFKIARQAYDAVNRPEVLRKLERTARIPALVIEEAFLQSNPALSANMVTMTCRNDYIQEARICLDKTLSPRPCGLDVRRDCTAKALFEPVQ